MSSFQQGARSTLLINNLLGRPIDTVLRVFEFLYSAINGELKKAKKMSVKNLADIIKRHFRNEEFNEIA